MDLKTLWFFGDQLFLRAIQDKKNWIENLELVLAHLSNPLEAHKMVNLCLKNNTSDVELSMHDSKYLQGLSNDVIQALLESSLKIYEKLSKLALVLHDRLQIVLGQCNEDLLSLELQSGLVTCKQISDESAVSFITFIRSNF